MLNYEKAEIEIIDLSNESNFFMASKTENQGADDTGSTTGGSIDGTDNDG